MTVNNLTVLIGTKFSFWIADQELPVIIGLIIFLFVSWGIYPIVAH